MLERFYFQVFKLLPTLLISRCVGRLTRAPLPRWIHRRAITRFAAHYRVALDEAEGPIEDYPTVGDFFMRRLRPGVRPVDRSPEAVVSPVDAVVGGLGEAGGAMLQAKGRTYSLAALLDDPELASGFAGGTFVTLYLSPRDYHRIHVPLRGDVERMRYIPGRLFPVNMPAVRTLPNLFCVNERLISYFRTDAGRIAVVKVGATCVGRIAVTYDPVVSNARGPRRDKSYSPPHPMEKGAELGHFEMGSTVILVFEAGRITLDPSIALGQRVQMGQRLASLIDPSRSTPHA